MLHTLGDLVDLCHADRVKSVSVPQNGAERDGQPCNPTKRLELLPGIFHDAMGGVAQLVFLFLGIDFGAAAAAVAMEPQLPATPGPPHHSPASKRKDGKYHGGLSVAEVAIVGTFFVQIRGVVQDSFLFCTV